MFDAVYSHIRDKNKTNILSPLLFTRHSVAMLRDGLNLHFQMDKAP